jgi:Uma2 family endonuclease
MATATKVSEIPASGSTKISLDEYLRTTYRPDVEYLDGELREKAVVGFAHGETQGFLFQWFSQRYQEWNIRCAVETRTQVSAKQVRLPDVVVIAAPDRTKGALDKPPLIAIEVLSPTDTYLELKARAADLEAMGVPNIWLIDEQARTAEVWANGSWHLQTMTRVEAVNSPIYLDLAWLRQQLDQ